MKSIFLSHSHKDKKYARRLANYFRSRYIKVWIDEAEIGIGDSLIQKISAGIEDVDYVGVILTKNSVKSAWVRKEVEIALTREINNKKVVVLPFLFENCTPPTFLKDKVYADFREPRSSRYRGDLNKTASLLTGSDVIVPQILESYTRQIGAAEVFQPPLSQHQIVGFIHNRLTLGLDQTLKSAFNNLNQQRELDDKKPHYANPRYRIIRPPYYRTQSRRREYILDLAEIDFAYLALLNEPAVDISTKQYINNLINIAASRVPKNLRTSHPYLNAFNKGLLGMQMVLVTSDGYTLLRRRSKDVLEYPEAWDVSYSGYCGTNAINKVNNRELEIWYTAKFELEKELAIYRADPRNIVFTGLHRSGTSGTTVLLGYWITHATRAELAASLNEKYPNEDVVFETTIKTEEIYVHRAKNLIVKFNGPEILNALTKAERKISNKSAILLPAAQASLLLALNANGKSTTELFT